MAHSRYILAALSSGLLMLHGRALAEDASRYRLEGTVTVEGTNLPLAGVEVQVLIESEPQSEKKVRSAKTNASGKYSVPLPQGHAWAWYIRPPAGYTPVKALDLQLIATTADLPVVVKNYQVRPGLAWNIDVRAGSGESVAEDSRDIQSVPRKRVSRRQ